MTSSRGTIVAVVDVDPKYTIEYMTQALFVPAGPKLNIDGGAIDEQVHRDAGPGLLRELKRRYQEGGEAGDVFPTRPHRLGEGRVNMRVAKGREFLSCPLFLFLQIVQRGVG